MGDLLEIADLRTEIRLRDATVRAVDGVSFTVDAGECLGLVGESGCGKTMTARSIVRLLPAGGVIAGGSVRLGGTELTGLPEQEMQRIRGNDVGMVFQDPSSSLNPTMTVGRQIAESVVVHRGADKQAAAARAVEALGLVRMPEPERVAAQYPHELSGGMRQRAMIAAALACEPRLLIADEPTTALDVTIQREILELIDDLRHQLGMAVILVTHDLGVIGGRTDKVAVMYGGRIVEQAATQTVFSFPRHPYTEALFEALPELAGPDSRALYSIPGRPPDLSVPAEGCSFAARCRYAQAWCTSHEPVLVGDHPGHTFACFYPAAAPQASSGDAARPVSAWLAPGSALRAPRRAANGTAEQQPLLRVQGLVKDYPVAGGLIRRSAATVSAVADVSLELPAGQTLGLVGESGCGKTTVARLLAGLERPDAGSIVFAGTDLARLSGRQRRRQGTGIQLMFQDSFASLDPRMRVRSILREPLLIQKAGRRRSHRRQVNRILDEVGLPPDAADRLPREFSGGQRQRLALARALIQRPALIVADEPVSALDVSVQAQILNLMRKLQRQYGLSYLFISHDLSVVRYMSDMIGVMYLGKLVEVGPAELICSAPAHPYTRGLIDAVPVVSTGPEPARQSGGLTGEPPAATDPPSGCRFRTRCPRAQEVCALQEPSLDPHAAAGQLVACHFPLTPVVSGAQATGLPGRAPSEAAS
ncbi:MAG TPA: ABC transporter ATP-binding protein [Streptosporangiaceae bacterium]|nr:ABC transporter ATP-binding protein [Streptosporangiaceae bacterium]